MDFASGRLLFPASNFMVGDSPCGDSALASEGQVRKGCGGRSVR
jgi:hypothetical protein